MLSCLTKVLWWFIWCLFNIVVVFVDFSAIVINTVTQNGLFVLEATVHHHRKPLQDLRQDPGD